MQRKQLTKTFYVLNSKVNFKVNHDCSTNEASSHAELASPEVTTVYGTGPTLNNMSSGREVYRESDGHHPSPPTRHKTLHALVLD